MNASLINLQAVGGYPARLLVGSLGRELPFVVTRFFLIENTRFVPTHRGGHAHREQHQLLVCVQGQAELRVDRGDRASAEVIALSTPDRAFYAPPLSWIDVELMPRSRLLVLSSGTYVEADYVRDRRAYEALMQEAA